jgi:hypothetical protein
MLLDVVRVTKQETVAVIAEIVDGVPRYLGSKVFPTERLAREYVSAHNQRVEATRVRNPLPERPPTVININGTIVKTRGAMTSTDGNDDGWFDENRDYRKPLSEDFEIDEGKDGTTVRRYRNKEKK